MKYPADLICEFSRKTGIKDPKLDVMMEQQKERNILWLPQPDKREVYRLFDKTATTFGVDPGMPNAEMHTVFCFGDFFTEEFDKGMTMNEYNDFLKQQHSEYNRKVSVDAQWRDITDTPALTAGEDRQPPL